MGIVLTHPISAALAAKECSHGRRGVLLNSRRRVSDPLPPSAALPLTEGENGGLQAFNLPLARGRRERSERGGRSNIILNYSWRAHAARNMELNSSFFPQFLQVRDNRTLR
jgi:hypothetical protein